MVKGETKTGFEFSVDDDALEDAEMLEALADVQNGDGLKVFYIMKRILGAEQKAAMYEHCRDAETGKIPVDALADELEDIFTAFAEDSADSKNS